MCQCRLWHSIFKRVPNIGNFPVENHHANDWFRETTHVGNIGKLPMFRETNNDWFRVAPHGRHMSSGQLTGSPVALVGDECSRVRSRLGSSAGAVGHRVTLALRYAALRFILRRDDGLGGSMTQIYRAGLRGFNLGKSAEHTWTRCICNTQNMRILGEGSSHVGRSRPNWPCLPGRTAY